MSSKPVGSSIHRSPPTLYLSYHSSLACCPTPLSGFTHIVPFTNLHQPLLLLLVLVSFNTVQLVFLLRRYYKGGHAGTFVLFSWFFNSDFISTFFSLKNIPDVLFEIPLNVWKFHFHALIIWIFYVLLFTCNTLWRNVQLKNLSWSSLYHSVVNQWACLLFPASPFTMTNTDSYSSCSIKLFTIELHGDQVKFNSRNHDLITTVIFPSPCWYKMWSFLFVSVWKVFSTGWLVFSTPVERFNFWTIVEVGTSFCLSSFVTAALSWTFQVEHDLSFRKDVLAFSTLDASENWHLCTVQINISSKYTWIPYFTIIDQTFIA